MDNFRIFLFQCLALFLVKRASAHTGTLNSRETSLSPPHIAKGSQAPTRETKLVATLRGGQCDHHFPTPRGEGESNDWNKKDGQNEECKNKELMRCKEKCE